MLNSSYRSAPLFLLLILILFFIDYITDGSLYPLFLIPIFLLLRSSLPFGWASVPIFSFLSIYVEFHTEIPILSFDYLYHFLFRYLILFILTYLLITYSSSIDQSRRRFDRLKQLLPICPDCGSLYCPDQQWRSLDYLLSNPEVFKAPIHDHCLIKHTSLIDKFEKQ